MLNPTFNPWIFWCGMGAFGVAVFFIWSKLYQKSLTPEGSRKRVSKILRRYAKLHKFRVIDGFSLTEAGETVTYDHVLVGYFGLMFITTFDKGLIVYGEPRSETWRIRHEAESFEIPNPLLISEHNFELIRAVFAREKIYGVPMEPLAVFTALNATYEPELLLSNTKQAVPISQLRHYLETPRLEKDAGVDLDKIYDLLQKYNTYSSK